jgi:hypothetical protein
MVDKDKTSINTVINREEFETLLDDLLYSYETQISVYEKKINALKNEYKNVLLLDKQYSYDKKVYDMVFKKLSKGGFDYTITGKKSIGFKYKGKE